jgi:hypothetical protein
VTPAAVPDAREKPLALGFTTKHSNTTVIPEASFPASAAFAWQGSTPMPDPLTMSPITSSLAAQEMFLYGSADWKKLKSAARRAAHVDGWQNDPIYGKLLSPKEQVKMPAVDESYRSIPGTAGKN